VSEAGLVDLRVRFAGPLRKTTWFLGSGYLVICAGLWVSGRICATPAWDRSGERGPVGGKSGPSTPSVDTQNRPVVDTSKPAS
jgi:hypothetical protein